MGKKTRVRLCGKGGCCFRLSARELGGVPGRGLTLHHLWGEPHEGSEAVGRERVQRTLCPRPGLLQGQEKVLERLPQRLLLPPLTRKLAHFLTLLQRG